MSATELLKSKEHLKLGQDEQGYTIEFRLNAGKGTSPICVPVELLSQVINALEEGPRVLQENNVVDTIRNSLAYDLAENGEELVVFRTRYGRGSKIHRIRKDEYEQVVTALKEINKDVFDVIAAFEDPDK